MARRPGWTVYSMTYNPTSTIVSQCLQVGSEANVFTNVDQGWGTAEEPFSRIVHQIKLPRPRNTQGKPPPFTYRRISVGLGESRTGPSSSLVLPIESENENHTAGIRRSPTDAPRPGRSKSAQAPLDEVGPSSEHRLGLEPSEESRIALGPGNLNGVINKKQSAIEMATTAHPKLPSLDPYRTDLDSLITHTHSLDSPGL
ncbi:hypothetical protein BJV74DRAFT_799632 [Russula compacta]|nr:hypothetical protein BJV74DRAFT_799632 [Russula compacta]